MVTPAWRHSLVSLVYQLFKDMADCTRQFRFRQVCFSATDAVYTDLGLEKPAVGELLAGEVKLF